MGNPVTIAFVFEYLIKATDELMSLYKSSQNEFYLECADKINLINKQILEEQKDEINQAKWANGN